MSLVVRPAACAGVTLSVLWMRTQLYQTVYRATMCTWLMNFLLKAFVNRVNLRMCIRIVRFWRSTYDVEMCAGSGSPVMRCGFAPMHSGGL